ncbi:MAG: IS630 family transposase [Oligoflexia bacterium]|nr:IS630 family transposase [Oligoflexia bacterium]
MQQSLKEVIRNEFDVLYSVEYISAFLKNIGFSFQKAKFVAAKADQDARDNWLRNTWPEVLSLAQNNNAMILFGDEASFPQWGSLSRTWSLKGHQPEIKTCGTRRAYKVFGAIDYFSGKMFSKGIDGKFNSNSYIEFIKSILMKTKKFVILIQDGARYHTSAIMKDFFEQNKKKLKVYQMPSYSPDYNPIEILWKKLKTKGIHLKYFPSFQSIIDKVNELLLYFKDNREEVLKVFGFYTKKEFAI